MLDVRYPCQKNQCGVLEDLFKDFSFCGNCPDWIHTNWPDDGLSYANMVEDIQNAE